MKKYKITTAKNAVKKGLKVGDKFWRLMEVTAIIGNNFSYKYCDSGKIRIPIPEPKPIDFGEAGRVLRYRTTVIMTTGFLSSVDRFSGYVLESQFYDKGYTNNDWRFSKDWTDITDTYKPT